jgi:FAD/FMN-containing dehydrogenase
MELSFMPQAELEGAGSGPDLAGAAALIALLQQRLGVEHVLTGAEDRAFYGQDMFSAGVTPACVVVAQERESLADAIRLCTEAGFAVVPRGGGLSYTGGYQAIRPRTVTVDLSRLNRILEINAEDMYVTVEVGCTWKQLFEALQPRGLRTPYFGPISGGQSTVGGALSQNSIYWGTASYGTSASSVLGLQVLLADGDIVTTGSGAQSNQPSPFFRNWGPDLTGMFLGDTGAFGLKLAATLQLMPLPSQTRFLSFAFDTHRAMLTAMAQVARAGLASECLGLDATIFGARLKQESVTADLGYLRGVIRAGDTLLDGLSNAARIALAGRKRFEDVEYAMHVTMSADSATIADEQVRQVRRIGLGLGREIAASFPRAARGNAYATGNGTMNALGRRYIPVHGLAPHSRAEAVTRDVYAFFAGHRVAMERLGIEFGMITAAVQRTGVLIEALIYWEDQASLYHSRMIEPSVFEKLPKYAHSDERNALVESLRAGLKQMFAGHGCCNLQIGKSYPYAPNLVPATRALLERVKDAVDPRRLVNPGSLGLQ